LSRNVVELWFDFASTYSYIAAERIEALAHGAGVSVAWRPFLLGPIFTSQQGIKDSPFNVNPVRGRYMWRDVERSCARFGIPWRRPSVFPRNSILAARIALTAVDEPWLANFLRAAFRANFAEDRDIAQREVMAELLSSAGASAEGILERAQSQENKDALRAQTERAEQMGLFGAPNLLADGELFFGQDRLEDAFAWLRAPWLPPAQRF
jgi:2-hydroxychromene-2-carboxylate isomerase